MDGPRQPVETCRAAEQHALHASEAAASARRRAEQTETARQHAAERLEQTRIEQRHASAALERALAELRSAPPYLEIERTCRHEYSVAVHETRASVVMGAAVRPLEADEARVRWLLLGPEARELDAD